MVTQLDNACHQSLDTPDGPSIVLSYQSMTGRRGRPRTKINPNFLSQALDLWGPTHLGLVFKCSACTVQRRALEHGLVDPGDPVYTKEDQPDGTISCTFTSYTHPVSTITDQQLDSFINDIFEIFPAFGWRMIAGRLKASGYYVPRERIAASFLRVHGSSGVFGDRSIHHKVYKVAGANSLWHHDGQHGMWF